MALFVFFLSSASWAQLAPIADPFWSALRLAPQSTAAPLPAQPVSFGGGMQLNSACTATANCGVHAPVACSGSGTCTAVDQDPSCPSSQQGYVVCDSVVTYCTPAYCPPPPPDCDQYDFGSCDYSWDKFSQCCIAPPPSPGYFCPDACF
jgi:hypothetical protein